MDKKEFQNYIAEEYDYHRLGIVLVNKILDYAEGMEQPEQFVFLTDMFEFVPHNILRKVDI